MNDPLVSVIIPCFDQAHYLPASIGSVLRQGYRRVETIVVDDGSTDRTADVAALYGATVLRQINRGLGAARNAGLRVAGGRFVLFLDADDELLPDAIETGVDALKQCERAACVVRRSVLMDEDSRPLPTDHPVLETNDLYREWLLRNFVWTPGAVLFRRDALAAIGGFPADAGPASDYAVYLALARLGTVFVDWRDAVRYRQHAANMSRDAVLMLRATLKVLQREWRHVPRAYASVFRKGRRAWCAYYGEQILHQLRFDWREGRRGSAQLRAVWVLLRHCPRVAAEHLVRKLGRVVRGLPAAPLEPARFAQTPGGSRRSVIDRRTESPALQQ